MTVEILREAAVVLRNQPRDRDHWLERDIFLGVANLLECEAQVLEAHGLSDDDSWRYALTVAQWDVKQSGGVHRALQRVGQVHGTSSPSNRTSGAPEPTACLTCCGNRVVPRPSSRSRIGYYWVPCFRCCCQCCGDTTETAPLCARCDIAQDAAYERRQDV